MKEIYLVRHGEARDDVEDLYGGSADHEPTEKGLKEAEEFAREFKGRRVQILISSPYKRAANPARIISKILQVPLEFDDGLKECDRYGILTGMKKLEAKAKYPEIVKAIENDEYVEGSESLEDFKNRVFSTLERFWEREEQIILALTHGGFIRFILGVSFKEFNMSHYGWFKITKENGACKILEKR